MRDIRKAKKLETVWLGFRFPSHAEARGVGRGAPLIAEPAVISAK